MNIDHGEPTDPHAVSSSVKHTQARLDHLLASVPASLWEFDLTTRVIRSVDTPSEEMSGRPDEFYVNRRNAWHGVLSPGDAVRMRQAMAMLQPGGTTVIEHRFVHSSGAEVASRTFLRRTVDPADLVLGVTVDVRELVAERARSQEMLDSLAGGVAYELNNALSAVYGHLSMLARLVHDARAQRSIAAAEGAAARAADITARLLSLAGRQALQPSSVNLNDVVREVVPEGDRSDGRLRIEHALAQDLPTCRVDRARATAALAELVVNAFEAMPDGGLLTVSTATIEVDGRELVEVAVRDTGCGMTSTQLAKATEPFFTTKTFGESAGLGLSTVHGFVTQSDGALVIESVAGMGTVARMRFATERGAVVQETVWIDEREPSASVLLVDRDAMVREVATQVLAMLGMHVVAAASADAALEAVTTKSIDILIADVDAGEGANGIALIEQLRVRRPSMGVVVLSRYAEDHLDIARLGRRVGFLAKPFTVPAVVRALRTAGWSGPGER